MNCSRALLACSMLVAVQPCVANDEPLDRPFRWPARMIGYVEQVAGAGLAGADVRLDIKAIRQYSAVGPIQTLVFSQITVTDQNGRYEFDLSKVALPAKPPLVVKVHAKAASFAETSTHVWYGAKTESARQNAQPLRMVPARIVRGRCVDPHRNPVAGAAIEAVYTPDGAVYEKLYDTVSLDPRLTNERGQFELAVPVGAMVQLWITSPDWVAQRVDVSSQADRVDVVLEAGTVVAGRLQDSRAMPIAGAVVVLENTDRGDGDRYGYLFALEQGVLTGEDGGFRLPPAQGDYKLYLAQGARSAKRVAWHKDRLFADYVVADEPPPPMLPRFFSLAGTGQQKLTLEAGAKLVLSGNVRWPDGSGAADVKLQVVYCPRENRPHAVRLGEAATDARGDYAIALPSPARDLTVDTTAYGRHKDPAGTPYHVHADPGKETSKAGQGFWNLDGPFESDIEGINWVLRPATER